MTEHPKANLVRTLELVRAEPGLSIDRICERIGLAAPTMSHVIDRLVAQGLVRRERSMRYHPERKQNLAVALVFPTESTAPAELKDGRQSRHASQALRVRVLQTVADNPGISKSDCARAVGMMPNSGGIAKAFRALIASGQLVDRGQGRNTELYVSFPSTGPGPAGSTVQATPKGQVARLPPKGQVAWLPPKVTGQTIARATDMMVAQRAGALAKIAPVKS